jgi:hypothetical protein
MKIQSTEDGSERGMVLESMEAAQRRIQYLEQRLLDLRDTLLIAEATRQFWESRAFELANVS